MASGGSEHDAPGASSASLTVAINLLRVVIPSTLLLVQATQLFTIAFRSLFNRLQASAFGETASGYQRLSDQIGNAAGSTRSTGTALHNGVPTTRPAIGPDENGILPVVVPVSATRRGLVYSLLSLLVLTYMADGALLIAHSITSMQWESTIPDPPGKDGDLPRTWQYEEYYILGSAAALVAQTLLLAWQERDAGLGKFRRPYVLTMLCLMQVGEVVLLGLLSRKIQLIFRGHVDGWTIAHVAAQATRILFGLFAILAFTPLLRRTEYLANEYTSLGGAGSSAQQQQQPGYGTFNGNGQAQTGVQQPSAAGANGSKKGDSGGASNAAAGPSAPIPEHKKSFLSRIRILGPYLWPKKSRPLQLVALFCFVLLGVGRVVNLFVPRTLGAIVDDLYGNQAPWKHILLYAFLRFLQGNGGLTQVLQSNLWIPVAQYSEREMSRMTFTHLLNLSLSFQVKKKTGEVLRTLDRGSAINSFFQTILFQLAPIAVDILVAIVYLWSTFGILLAALIMVIMLSYVAASVILTRLRVKLRRDMNDKDKFTRGIHADALANWETIKYFTAEEREINRYIDAMKDYQRAESKVIASLNFLNLTQNTIISFGLLVGCLIVAFTVVQGKRNVGQFIMFLTYLNQLYGPLNILGTLYRVIQTNITDTDNLMKLLAEETEINDRPDAVELGDAQGEIELDHVNFTYDGKVTALKDLTVKIPPGTSVALVGESGAGKSTLLRLLYRFYDVTDGTIRFDGKDIRAVTQTSLRRAIGVVPQEAVLFNESIAYNIAYGKDGATQAEVEEAAKAARIYDRIMGFPERWDTKVGERGVRLSGGEKQRVSIARAILKDPAILLLDEATSALDTATEREIQASLRSLAQGRTSIAIAHRLSTITYSDLILVLKDGEIVERGDHKELLQLKGLYYNLWQKQIRAEEEALDPKTIEKKLKKETGTAATSAAVTPSDVSRSQTPDSASAAGARASSTTTTTDQTSGRPMTVAEASKTGDSNEVGTSTADVAARPHPHT